MTKQPCCRLTNQPVPDIAKYTLLRQDRLIGQSSHTLLLTLYFVPRVILYNFFSFWLIYEGLGFWGWGPILGFLGWAFQLMGFGACGVGLSGFFWGGALYINIIE